MTQARAKCQGKPNDIGKDNGNNTGKGQCLDKGKGLGKGNDKCEEEGKGKGKNKGEGQDVGGGSSSSSCWRAEGAAGQQVVRVHLRRNHASAGV